MRVRVLERRVNTVASRGHSLFLMTFYEPVGVMGELDQDLDIRARLFDPLRKRPAACSYSCSHFKRGPRNLPRSAMATPN